MLFRYLCVRVDLNDDVFSSNSIFCYFAEETFLMLLLILPQFPSWSIWFVFVAQLEKQLLKNPVSLLRRALKHLWVFFFCFFTKGQAQKALFQYFVQIWQFNICIFFCYLHECPLNFYYAIYKYSDLFLFRSISIKAYIFSCLLFLFPFL